MGNVFKFLARVILAWVGLIGVFTAGVGIALSLGEEGSESDFGLRAMSLVILGFSVLSLYAGVSWSGWSE